jgi:DNA polymerase-1
MSKTNTRLPDSSQTLYLIDISSFIFRAFFAIRSLHNKAGEPTNAVYGVATMLARLAEEAKPSYLAVVYDSREPSFRKEIYSEYKANRSEAPEDLVPQFSKIEDLIRSFEIHSYRQSGIEADDLIATLTKRWCKESPKHRVVIVSSDKDLMQLVNDRVSIWDTMSNKIYGSLEVEEKFNVKAEQIRDYLGLVGDSSDNIPGVPSIGPKSASDLLREYGTLDGILEAAKAGKILGKKGEVLKNHEADARLSAQLATVREDLKVEIPLKELTYHFHTTPQLIDLLRDLDFHSLITKWTGQDWSSGEGSKKAAAEVPSPGPSPSPVAELTLDLLQPDERFRTINSEKAFEEVLEKIREKGEFGFDLETTSLNPREAQIVGVAVCYDSSFGCYIPVGHQDTSQPQLPREYVLRKLKPILEDPKIKKIGQNLKYDWSVLIENGIHPEGIGADTMVAAYLLDPTGRHNLETLAAQHLSYSVLNYEQVCGKGKDQLCFDQISIQAATRYSAEDAWVAVQLWNKLKPLLEADGLMDLFNGVDIPLIPVLTKMETQGVCIDSAWLKKLSSEFEKELKQIEERVFSHSKAPINLNSPKQLAQLLFQELGLPPQGKTKTGFSTDAQVLDALAPMHEVPRLLLEYREISKLKGTYVDPLPQLRDLKTGKIHTSFHQTVAATGRLSCSDPNLQNIPIRSERGLKIRRAFIPSEGNVLLSADYSQIELRLLAHMSGDPELTQSFQKEEDVHRRTASEIFGVTPEKVEDHQRNIAKAINFGLMYGKTAFGLSQELKIPRREAQDMIVRYFTRYRAVKEYLDSQILMAKEKGMVMSLLGRKRRLPDVLSKNAAIRANAERMAMNTPIQGTAADLMKLAMIEIERCLEKEGFQSKLIIQVHDEVVLDCPKSEAEKVKERVVSIMENAMKLSVPLRVNAAIGENWMQL